MARPSSYTEETASTLCERIAEGESLRAICTDDEMPNKSTVFRWLEEHPEFATKYARAREAQGEEMDGLIYDTAVRCTPETAAADRVKIDAFKWRAAKLAPKRYGDKIQVGGDPDGAPIKVEDSGDVARRLAFLLASAQPKDESSPV